MPEVDPSDVAQLERAAGVFRVTTVDGAEADARVVVIAVGVTPFPHAPPPFDGAMGDGIGFAIERQDYEAYRGGRVVVVGGGQGGLEATALARRAGAEVELVIRSQLRWFTDREPYRPRGRLQQRIYRLAYPVVGYGPPPLNRLALNPDAFAALPPAARRSVARRILRAGGSPWVRDQIEGRVRVTEGVAVERVERRQGAVHLQLSDGSAREADAVVVFGGLPLRPRPPRLPLPDGQGRGRPARRMARARPLLPLHRPGSPVRRLRRRAALRADRSLRVRQPLHGVPRPRGIRPPVTAQPRRSRRRTGARVHRRQRLHTLRVLSGVVPERVGQALREIAVVGNHVAVDGREGRR